MSEEQTEDLQEVIARIGRRMGVLAREMTEEEELEINLPAIESDAQRWFDEDENENIISLANPHLISLEGPP